MTATGTLIQKIARQVHWVSQPPAIGPIAVRPPLTPKKMASALPRSRSGNAATTTASAAGKISARRDALDDPEDDEPGLGERALGRRAAQRRRDGEDDDADQHHPPVAEDVGEPAAEREDRRQRQQVGVDHPLDAAAA